MDEKKIQEEKANVEKALEQIATAMQQLSSKFEQLKADRNANLGALQMLDKLLKKPEKKKGK